METELEEIREARSASDLQTFNVPASNAPASNAPASDAQASNLLTSNIQTFDVSASNVPASDVPNYNVPTFDMPTSTVPEATMSNSAEATLPTSNASNMSAIYAMPVNISVTNFNAYNENVQPAISKSRFIAFGFTNLMLGFLVGFLWAALFFGFNEHENQPVPLKSQPTNNIQLPSYPYYPLPTPYGYCPVYLSRSTHLINDFLSKFFKNLDVMRIETPFLFRLRLSE